MAALCRARRSHRPHSAPGGWERGPWSRAHGGSVEGGLEKGNGRTVRGTEEGAGGRNRGRGRTDGGRAGGSGGGAHGLGVGRSWQGGL